MKCVFCESERNLTQIGYLRYIMGAMISQYFDWNRLEKIKNEYGAICPNCLGKLKQDRNDLGIIIHPYQYKDLEHIGNGNFIWYFDIIAKQLLKMKHPELDKDYFKREITARSFSEARIIYIDLLLELSKKH